jgi:hypothetical protein
MANAPADVLADAARRRLAMQTGAQQAKSTLNEDYATNSQRAQEAYDQKQRDMNSLYASRGTFNGGMRVDEQGRLSRDYSGQVTDLANAKRRGLQNVDLSVQSGENDIQTMLDSAARDETQKQLNAQLQNQQQQAQQAFYNQQNAYSAQANQQQQAQADSQAAAERQFWQGIQDKQVSDYLQAVKAAQDQQFWAEIARQQQKDTGNYRMQGRPF